MSSKAIKPRRRMEQSMTLYAVHVLFALFFFEPVDLQFFLRRQCQLMAGPGFELRTSCTGRANVTHTPPRQNTLALPKCPAVYHRATCVYYYYYYSTSFGTACPTVFPALTASSCRRITAVESF